MIRYYAREESEDWIPDRYVGGKEVVLHQTEEIRDTYWLMEAMLDNMDREFGGSLYGK
jgi:hypothetical protein